MADVLARVFKALGRRWRWRLLKLRHDTFIVGTTGAVFDERGRLLVLRHRFWVGDPWGLPSGWVEHGETWEQGFAREVSEETGLRVRDVRLLEVISGVGQRVEALMTARVDGAVGLRLDDGEVTDARFVEVEDVVERLRESQGRAVRLALRE